MNKIFVVKLNLTLLNKLCIENGKNEGLLEHSSYYLGLEQKDIFVPVKFNERGESMCLIKMSSTSWYGSFKIR